MSSTLCRYFGPLIVAAGLGVVGYLQFESVGWALGVAGLAMAITTVEGFWLTPAFTARVAEMNRIAIFAGIMGTASVPAKEPGKPRR